MNFFQKNKHLVLILILALGLRLPHLNGSFWLDEAAQALESSRPFSQQLDIIPDFQPPLLHLITHFTIQFSRAEWWLRTWGALIPGLITIWATYKIGEKLFNKKTGLLASIFLATSSFHIFFSQELRPYSLPAMWAMLSTLALIEVVRKNKIRLPDYQRTRLLDYEITKLPSYQITRLLIYSVAGLYSSYLYPFFLLAQFAYLLLMKKIKIKYLFSMSAIIFAFYLPWLPMFFKQLQAGQLLRSQMPGWENVVSLTQIKAIPLTLGKFIFGIINLDVNPVFIAISTIILLLILNTTYHFLKNSNREQKKNLFLLTFTFTTTLVLAWLISFWVPVIRPKRLLFLLPLLYLGISATISIKKTKSIKHPILNTPYPILNTMLILILNTSSLFQLYTNPLYQREDWRSLHNEVKTRFPEKDTLIVTSFTEVFSPWRWYDPNKEYSSLSTGSYFIDDVPDLTQTLKPINDYQYILVFDYLRDLTDPDDKLLNEIEAYGYKGIGVIDYPNIGFVRIYAKENTTISLIQNTDTKY